MNDKFDDGNKEFDCDKLDELKSNHSLDEIFDEITRMVTDKLEEIIREEG